MGKIYARGRWWDRADYAAELAKERVGEGPAVYGDIKPYRGVAFKGQPMVNSRSQHRELIRSHGAVEVGSEKPAFMK